MLHRTFRSFFVLILAFGLVALPSPPSARAAGPWYVTPTGDDNNDCLSPATPCATINGTIAKASSGDTILISIGTYTDSGSDVARIFGKSLTFSGGWDESFSIQSGMSTLDGQGVRAGITTAAQFSGMAISVERLIIQNSTQGVYIAGDWSIHDSIIRGNSGIGISVPQGSLTLDNSSVIGNDFGINATGNAVVVNNSIINNNARRGISYFGSFSPSLTINNSSISSNTGGGIEVRGSVFNVTSVDINNSTIANNRTDTFFVGGGMLLHADYGLNLTINNSTISGNWANSGGGVYIEGIINTVTIRNTILADNNATNTSHDCFGGINSSDHNIIGDTSGCTVTAGTGDLFNIDPILGSFLPVQGYFPLLSGSPAIDAGDNSSCLNVDQRGLARTQGTSCDMGAYEYTVPGPATALSVVRGDNQKTLTAMTFPNPFQVAAIDSQGSPVSGVTIDFSAPGSGASGIFADTGTTSTSVITDQRGVATTSAFMANNQAGAYTVSASSAGLSTLNFSVEQVIRPANDGFAGAQVISLPFTTTADITNATTELNEPGNCYTTEKTVWYLFTPAESMVVQANVLGSTIEGNLNIYRAGSDISDMQFLVCTGPSTSPTFLAEANQTYYLQVGPASGGAGEVQINVEAVAPPGNDSFASAIDVGPLPSAIDFNIAGATFESSEPLPSCVFSPPPFRTVWFKLTAGEDQAISTRLVDYNFSAFVAAYSGTSLDTLMELGCQQYPDGFPVQLTAGQTYYFQVGVMFGEGGTGTLSLDPPAPPMADFSYFPFEPSSFSVVQFCDNSFDPAHIGFESFTWDFGDEAASTDICALHQYAADGDYSVQHAATTIDGRTASTSQVIHVRTHDISITRVTAPQSAHSGQTKPITVSIRNTRYAETVTVDLFKSSPNGDTWIGALTLEVPVLSGNRTRLFTFNYTFTPEDAQIGKVTFKAIATLVGANDAFTQDNTGISSPPTRVTR